MMDNNFDPYEMLINLQERLHRLEQAHNQMAHAYRKTEVDLSVTLHSLRSLQQSFLTQSQIVQELINHSTEK